MREKFTTVISFVRRFVASSRFFVGTMVVFCLQTLWVILSSNLLPYDEYYHLGIIKIYATQWSPILQSQPAEASLYGDITRLPSYLFHYLTSFPYRFFELCTHDQTTLIILLRLLNLAMVVGGIVLFRKLFLRAGISRAVINLSAAVFALTPIVVILAAQSNYDNMMFLLTPIFLMLAYKLVTEKPTVARTLMILSVGMIASLVKNSFLVIFGVVGLYILVSLIVQYKTGVVKVFLPSLKGSKKSLIIAGALFIVVSGLFIERYGINEIKYQKVVVECDQVQSTEVCSHYTVWRRNQNALKLRPYTPLPYGGAVSFTKHWVKTVSRGYFAVYANIIPDQPVGEDPYGVYEFKPLLKVPIRAGVIMLGFGLAAVILQLPALWRKNKLNQITLLSGPALIVALWLFNYTFYIEYGKAYAIQSRYILPLLLPMIAVIAQAFVLVTKKTRLQWAQAVLLIAVTLYLLSGGAMGWIIRSRPTWYWHSDTVLQANTAAKEILNPIIWH